MSAPPTFDLIRLTLDARGVCTLLLNRPKVKNATSHQMYVEFADALDWCTADARCNVVIVTGAGDYFSSGADLRDKDTQKWFGTPSADAPVGRFMTTVHHFPKPLIAAVNGPAVGVGVTLLPHCARRDFAEHTFFSDRARCMCTAMARMLIPAECSAVS